MMPRKKIEWVNKLVVEVFMLEPYQFDEQHDVILNYVDQELRSRNTSLSTSSYIPIQFGFSSGIMNIKEKSPTRAFRLPPAGNASKYMKLIVKNAKASSSHSSIWDYRPRAVEPVWYDDTQVNNAKMLKAYLTCSELKKTSPLVLMTGPPGTGKSMVLDHVLSEQANIFKILKVVTFNRTYVGETANSIINVTNEAIDMKPSIIVLEEADALFQSRWIASSSHGGIRNHLEETVSTLLQCIDRLADEGGVYLLATTNMDADNEYVIDPAIVSRIGLRLNFPVPNEKTFLKVAKELCEKNKVPFDVVRQAISEVVGKKKPSYRDIMTAIGRVNLMRHAGIEETKVQVQPSVVSNPIYIH